MNALPGPNQDEWSDFAIGRSEQNQYFSRANNDLLRQWTGEVSDEQATRKIFGDIENQRFEVEKG